MGGTVGPAGRGQGVRGGPVNHRRRRRGGSPDSGRSPYIGFHGGRGVAPAAGGAIILAPIILLAIFPVFALTILVTRISSVGSLSASLIGGIVMIVVAAVTPLAPIYFVYGVGVPGLIWAFHLDNIGRLLRGEERRIGSRSKPAASDPTASQTAHT
jgi:glycerol-3-phosphate acyltransferase PlsY